MARVSGQSTFTGGRKTYRKKRYGKQALNPNQAKAVNKMISTRLRNAPEKKHHDYAVPSGSAIQAGASGGRIDDICQVGQGTSVNQRIGDNIRPVYAGLRYVLSNPSASSAATSLVRVILLEWREDDGVAPPTLIDVVQTISSPLSYYKSNDTKSFKVLYDARHVVASDISNPDNTVIADVSIDHKKLSTIQYNGGAAAGSNKLYLLSFSDQATPGNQPLMQARFRLRYTDM